jgi:hypothetical protein
MTKEILPAPFLRALKADNYDNEGSDFTVTQLLSPPKRTYLEIKNKKKENGDYAGYAALMGTTIHKLLEDNHDPKAGETVEKRHFMEMNDCKVSGCVDLYEKKDKRITDYKFVGGHMDEIKEPYRLQLHMNGYLASQNGVEVKNVSLFVIQRDWSFLRSRFDSKYPQTPYTGFHYKYDEELAISTFGRTVAEHIKARDGHPRPCTPDEQWRKPTMYACKKPANKRARKLHTSKIGAELDLKKGELVEVREGEATYCEHFCGFKDYCAQYKRENNK